MHTKTIIIASVVILGILFFLLKARNAPVPLTPPENSTLNDTRNGAPPPLGSTPESTPPGVVTVPLPTIQAEELRALRSAAPKHRTVWEEAEQDPHTTPPSLLKFAREMAPLMERALANPKDAELLTNELEQCMLNDTLAQSARALCLSNAERLAAKHPGLKNQAEAMKRKASPEIARLVDASKKFRK